jgi:hypothetical protein
VRRGFCCIFENAEEQARKRFDKYINGPMGVTILEKLEEGESFILQTSEYAFRISKKKGRGVIELVLKFDV